MYLWFNVDIDLITFKVLILRSNRSISYFKMSFYMAFIWNYTFNNFLLLVTMVHNVNKQNNKIETE
jgi:hypothetical protein